MHNSRPRGLSSYGELEITFGKRVAELVLSHTEDKSKSWRERKQNTIAHFAAVTDYEKAGLWFADALANLRSIVRDYEIVGEDIWNRFKQGRSGQLWYYEDIRKYAYGRVDNLMYREYCRLYDDLVEAVFQSQTLLYTIM